jgi:t-SNARE complex subunit (syntaxin)
VPRDIERLLGRIEERTERTDETVLEIRKEQIDIQRRLARGDRKFDELAAKIDARKPEVGPWEMHGIEVMRVVIYLVVLWASGSLEIAARIAGVK